MMWSFLINSQKHLSHSVLRSNKVLNVFSPHYITHYCMDIRKAIFVLNTFLLVNNHHHCICGENIMCSNTKSFSGAAFTCIL